MAPRPKSAPASGRIGIIGQANPPPQASAVNSGPGVFRSFQKNSKFTVIDPLRHGHQPIDSFSFDTQSSKELNNSFRALDISRFNKTRHKWARLDTFQTPTGHLGDSGEISSSRPRPTSPTRNCCNFQVSMLQDLEADVFEEFQNGLRTVTSDINTNMNTKFSGLRQEIMARLDGILSVPSSGMLMADAHVAYIADEVKGGSLAVLESLKDIRAGIANLDVDDIRRSIHDSQVATAKGQNNSNEEGATGSRSKASPRQIDANEGVYKEVIAQYNTMKESAAQAHKELVESLREERLAIEQAVVAIRNDVPTFRETDAVLAELRNVKTGFAEFQHETIMEQCTAISVELQKVIGQDFGSQLQVLQDKICTAQEEKNQASLDAVIAAIRETGHSRGVVQEVRELTYSDWEPDPDLDAENLSGKRTGQFDGLGFEKSRDEILLALKEQSNATSAELRKIGEDFGSELRALHDRICATQEEKNRASLDAFIAAFRETGDSRGHVQKSEHSENDQASDWEPDSGLDARNLARTRTNEFDGPGIEKLRDELLLALKDQSNATSAELRKEIGEDFGSELRALNDQICATQEEKNRASLDAISQEMQKVVGQDFGSDLRVLHDKICATQEEIVAIRDAADSRGHVRKSEHVEGNIDSDSELEHGENGKDAVKKSRRKPINEVDGLRFEKLRDDILLALKDDRPTNNDELAANISALSQEVHTALDLLQGLKEQKSDTGHGQESEFSQPEQKLDTERSTIAPDVLEHLSHLKEQGDQLRGSVKKLDESLTCQFRSDIHDLSNEIKTGQKETTSKIQTVLNLLDGMSDVLNSK